MGKTVFYYFGLLLGTGSVLGWAAAETEGVFSFWKFTEIAILMAGWIFPLVKKRADLPPATLAIAALLICSAAMKLALMYGLIRWGR